MEMMLSGRQSQQTVKCAGREKQPSLNRRDQNKVGESGSELENPVPGEQQNTSFFFYEWN